jgi:hypothetical protein
MLRPYSLLGACSVLCDVLYTRSGQLPLKTQLHSATAALMVLVALDALQLGFVKGSSNTACASHVWQ